MATVKHLSSGGTIGYSYTACGIVVESGSDLKVGRLHHGMPRFLSRRGKRVHKAIYLDDVTCGKCLSSSYAKLHGRKRPT